MNKKDITKYIAYFTMGDGCLYQPKTTKYPYIRISHVEEHEEYINWKYEILSTITKCSLKLIEQHPNAYGTKKLWELRSLTHPIYGKIRERLYIQNRRVINPHYLTLLDWEALSILYQDDGGISQSKNRPNRTPCAILGMSSYSYGDLYLLKRALKDKLNLEWNVQSSGRGYYRLYLRTKDYPFFVDNIQKYIFNSFKYKIPMVGSRFERDDEIV